MIGKRAARYPTKEAQQSSKRTGFFVQRHIEQSIKNGEEKPKIQDQEVLIKETDRGVLNYCRSEVHKHKSSKQDWPHKHHMNQHVHGITMVCSIESKMLFKIKQSHFYPFSNSSNKRKNQNSEIKDCNFQEENSKNGVLFKEINQSKLWVSPICQFLGMEKYPHPRDISFFTWD